MSRCLRVVLRGSSQASADILSQARGKRRAVKCSGQLHSLGNAFKRREAASSIVCGHKTDRLRGRGAAYLRPRCLICSNCFRASVLHAASSRACVRSKNESHRCMRGLLAPWFCGIHASLQRCAASSRGCHHRPRSSLDPADSVLHSSTPTRIHPRRGRSVTQESCINRLWCEHRRHEQSRRATA